MNTAVQPKLPVVQAPSLVEHVYRHLRGCIIAGTLVAGSRLLELDLASQMRVSQGSAREALGRLERDGLVERRERRGTFVTAVSVDDMREIFALRAYIERFAAQRIAGIVNARQVRDLESVLADMCEAIQHHHMLACIEHDHTFHQHIVAWANNATLLRIWRPLSAQIQRFTLASPPPGWWDPAALVAAHQHLIDVLRGGDAEKGAAEFEQHSLRAWQQLERARIPARSDIVVTSAGHDAPHLNE